MLQKTTITTLSLSAKGAVTTEQHYVDRLTQERRPNDVVRKRPLVEGCYVHRKGAEREEEKDLRNGGSRC